MNNLLINKKWLLIADFLLIPSGFFFRWLSAYMLSIPKPCPWTLFGGKCVTCGGTHFVNSILNGRFIEAFNHNQFLFLLTVFLLLSYVLLHLYVFFKTDVVKKILRIIFSIPTLIIVLSAMLLFLLLRNLPVFFMIAKFLLSLL